MNWESGLLTAGVIAIVASIAVIILVIYVFATGRYWPPRQEHMDLPEPRLPQEAPESSETPSVSQEREVGGPEL
jgi:hypothetical protein